LTGLRGRFTESDAVGGGIVMASIARESTLPFAVR